MKPIPNSLLLEIKIDEVDPAYQAYLLKLVKKAYNAGYDDAKREILYTRGGAPTNIQN